MSAISPQAKDAFQKVLDDAVAKGAPGIVAGVTNGQEILWTGSAGKKELGSSENITPRNVFWIASCTKMITAMAVMQLVEQGKLQLDVPIAKVVPELASPQIIENGQLRPAKTKDITLRQLLTHTGGFSYTFFNDDLKVQAEKAGADEFDGRLEPHLTPLVGEPGKVWRYGTNIDVAGLILERTTGMKLGEYFKKHIFDPVGANDIAFEVGNRSDRLAGMHQRSADGKLSSRKHFPVAYKSPEFHAGGSGLFSDVESYLRVIQVLLNEGKAANGAQILKPETVKDMFQNHVPEDVVDQLELPIHAARRDLANPLDNLLPGAKKGWGLSFLVNLSEWAVTGRTAGSGQWAGLANLFWTADPIQKLGVFLQSQVLPFGDPIVFPTFIELERTMYEQLKK